MNARIDFPGAAVEDFRGRHQIRQLALFGTVALRDGLPADSDVDVLVEQ